MTCRRLANCLFVPLLLGFAAQASAQLPQTKLMAVFPPGGKAGTSFDVAVTNSQDLFAPASLVFNHEGLHAVAKTSTVNGREEPSATQFTVTVDSNVPAGIYEVCVHGPYGLSNPRAFVVSRNENVEEKEPNNDLAAAMPLETGVTVNGRVNGGTDVDCFKLNVKQGERLTIGCLAKRIDSRLDAVLELYGPDGRRQAVGRDSLRGDPLLDFTVPADGEYTVKLYDFVYGGSNDHVYRLEANVRPYVDFVVPPAGVAGSTSKYTVYGRNLPGGQPTEMTLAGQPLQSLETEITLPAETDRLDWLPGLSPSIISTDLAAFRIDADAGSSNSIPIGLVSAPLTAEQEPNNDAATAQKLTLPAEVYGQSLTRGDLDLFRFDVKKGDEYWIEIYGERLGFDSDPYMTIDRIVTEESGEKLVRVTAQDDQAANPLPGLFDLISDDPEFRFVAPEDGTYQLAVRDRFFASRGGPRLIYRVSIRKPDPDYRVAVLAVPPLGPANKIGQSSTVALRRGDKYLAEVLAFRRDGFNGAIKVRAEGLPAGVTCPETVIGPGVLNTSLVFHAAETAEPWQGAVNIVATAENVGERGTVEHAARIGTIVWDGAANVPAVSRVATQLTLSVMEETAPVEVVSEPVNVVANHNRQILIPVSVVRRLGFDDNVTFTFADVPKNLQVENKPINKGTDAELFRVFVPPNVAVGDYTMYLSGQAQVSYAKNPAAVEQAKAYVAETTQLFQAAEEALKTATEAKNASVEAVKKADQESKAAQQLVPAAEKKVQDATAAVNQAKEAVAGATDEAGKQAAEEQLNQAEQNLQTANAELEKAQADAKTAQEALVTAQTAEKTAEAARVQAEQARKAAEDRKKADEKRLADAEKAAKPANVNVFAASLPVVISVRPAPLTLTANVPNDGALKVGEAVDVKVTVKRNDGFAGPVTLTLPLPPNVTGLTAEPVTIAADATEGTLSVKAVEGATEGEPANLVVRAEAEFNGQALVDQPIKLKVSK